METEMTKYKTIVIDPPWDIKANFTNVMRTGLKTDLPYTTMTDSEITQFPIGDFTDDISCALFMWTTHSKLPATLDIIKTWKFKYHCMFVWHKNHAITTLGINRNCEFIVFAYKGKYPFRYKGKALFTCFKANVAKHSEKPTEFYAMIKPKTSAPRIDIFARKRHDGFDAWGDQVESKLQTTLEND